MPHHQHEANASPPEKPFLVYLDPDTHQALKLKSVHDGESMRSITRRLVRLYITGQLPAAEPEANR